MKDYILEQSLSPTDAAARLGIAVDELDRRRHASTLLGVWVPALQRWAYPSFQFAVGVSEHGRRLLFSTLASRYGFSPTTDDRGGWARAYWLFQPREELSLQSRASRGHGATDPVTVATLICVISAAARAPADAFADDPVAVIELAQSLIATKAMD